MKWPFSEGPGGSGEAVLPISFGPPPLFQCEVLQSLVPPHLRSHRPPAGPLSCFGSSALLGLQSTLRCPQLPQGSSRLNETPGTKVLARDSIH